MWMEPKRSKFEFFDGQTFAPRMKDKKSVMSEESFSSLIHDFCLHHGESRICSSTSLVVPESSMLLEWLRLLFHYIILVSLVRKRMRIIQKCFVRRLVVWLDRWDLAPNSIDLATN